MDNRKSTGGRPPGRKKTAKIEVVLQPEVKNQFMSIMDREGKSASVELGEWIKRYIDKYNS